MATRALNGCRESFLDRFTALQLLKLHEMWVASEWDIRPDEWSAVQVRRALRGKVPTWNDDGSPVE
jgi:hypothetical protein